MRHRIMSRLIPERLVRRYGLGQGPLYPILCVLGYFCPDWIGLGGEGCPVHDPRGK